MGDESQVTARAGSLRATVEVADEVMPGVLSLPHGWATAPGIRMKVAAEHAGENRTSLR